jgi:uncharacterized membrane protein YeiH
MIVLKILEIVGTIAFAVSGAFVAIKAKLDLFGVLFIGCITAVGGGIVRDLLIGATPPAIFSRAYILFVALGASALVFLLAYIKRKKFDEIQKKVEYVNTFFDAVGLAAFTVMGTEVAFVHGIYENAFLSIALGILTGVGGGIFRDVLTDTTPYIFKKHVYALASIGGAIVYYLIRYNVEKAWIPSLIAGGLIVIIRMLAAHFRWSLPKVHFEENEK